MAINMSDEILAQEALKSLDDNGTIAQLFERYEPTIRAIAANYFVAGGDSDDVIQEGRLGLFKALLNYNEDKSDRFKPFAIMCIKHQIQSAALSASRRKHMPLNSYISLDNTGYENDDDFTFAPIAETEDKNPEAIVIDRENRESLGDIINSLLSEAEIEVLQEYIKGESYKAIAQRTNRSVKAVDNMLQSIKRKLKQRITE